MMNFLYTLVAIAAGFLAYGGYTFWRDVRRGQDPSNGH